MDGAGDEFFTGPGFAGDENGGVGGSHFGYEGKHRLEGRRSTHDLLEHRGLVDFFAESHVLVLKSLFSLLAVFNVGPGDIPTCNLSLLVVQWIVTDQKPAILSVVSP